MLIDNGQILKAIIESEGLTQQEYADQLDINIGAVKDAIYRNRFTDNLVKKMGDRYGVDYTFLQRNDLRNVR